MYKHVAGWLLILVLLALLLTQGRAQTPTPPIVPASRTAPADKRRDGTHLPPPVQPIFYSAHRAMDWLKRANKTNGRFVYGFLPALRVPMEGDNFLSQAGATFALARASRYFQEEGHAAVARQAALSLLMDTTTDGKDPSVRFTALPAVALNRLASHGELIRAIHELAAPGKDLLDQADQLANYLRKQQRSDGALVFCDTDAAEKHVVTDFEISSAGIALHGVIRSHKQRPAEWKIAWVRNGMAHYFAAWNANKVLATVVNHTPAYAEAYAQTKEPAFKDAVFAMNDWLLGLQYREEHNLARKHWMGGFPRWSGGKQETGGPDISSALPAESLAEACRVAKLAGDLPRLRRYEDALLRSLHFLMSLQYSSARVQHFVDDYRPAILGAFYGSHQDGNLRLEYTQHALCAMVQYLDAVIQ